MCRKKTLYIEHSHSNIFEHALKATTEIYTLWFRNNELVTHKTVNPDDRTTSWHCRRLGLARAQNGSCGIYCPIPPIYGRLLLYMVNRRDKNVAMPAMHH